MYKACAISTRLYGSESWTSYAVQERKQKSSTSDIYVEFWEYSGKTKSPIMRSFTESVSHLCIPYATYDGLDTCIGWRMAAFQKTCKVNWPHGTETKVVPNFVTKTSALKMDYINWESLADNKAAWKQELSCSLKKGTRPQRNLWRETQGKERVLVIKCTPKWWLCFTCQGWNRHCIVTHRTVQRH